MRLFANVSGDSEGTIILTLSLWETGLCLFSLINSIYADNLTTPGTEKIHSNVIVPAVTENSGFSTRMVNYFLLYSAFCYDLTFSEN